MMSRSQWAEANTTRLSPNFALAEVLKSSHADLVEWPTREIMGNLKLGAEMLLQPFRNAMGATRINSGYRSRVLNRAIGGSDTSDHMDGAAFDLNPIARLKAVPETIRKDGVEIPLALFVCFNWIQTGGLYYRQVILYLKSRFIHVSFNHAGKPYKKQALVFQKN